MSSWQKILIAPLAAGMWFSTVEAQETVSPDRLLSLSGQELETGQVKLTYLGPQTEPIPTLVLTVHDHAVNWEAFGPWQRPEHRNDEIYQRYEGTKPSLTVSAEELRAVVQNLKGVLEKPAKRLEAPWLSMTVVARAQGRLKGFEAQLDHFLAGELFILMRGSLRADPKDVTLMEGQANLDAMRTLQWWGCGLGLLPTSIPARDVSEQVQVNVSGLRWKTATKQFMSMVTLTNVSGKPIPGPISLVLYPGVNVSMANATGTTCVTTPSGREFLNVPMPGLALEPQQTLETVLEFDHEEGAGLSFTTKVLAGVGER